MSGPEEGRDPQSVGRFDVPQQVPAPDAEPARRNGHRPAAQAAPTPTEPPASTTPPASAPTPTSAPTSTSAPSDEVDAGLTGGTEPAVSDRPGDHWDRKVANGLAFLRRRLSGDYEVDEFGFDSELTDAVFHPLLRLLYRDWFRTEVSGVEHVPVDGPALVVGNHSGTVALDALILSAALHDKHPAHRYLRLLGADLVFRMPVVSELARKTGGTVACNPDAERLLGGGDLVGVFPEGFKGIGKLYADRYKLQRFGRGGFVSAALRTGTPIVPVAIVGGEEIYPMLADIKPLARLLKLPYFPVTPTFPLLGPLGMVPLPSKWLIEFCPPIPTAHLTDSADDPLVVFNLADQVRETIQQTLHTLLERRPDPFGP
ncbi:2-acylglycerol O-acyltransferase [Micromonospora noduli]|nr:2-acylglycerol O-acyltransferase [Micromonospora noduli]